MSKEIRILKYSFIFMLIALLAGTGCASAKKNIAYKNKQKDSLCDLSHLGRNKYYYSNYYQKKLARSTKKISGK
jgi:hypothetical protein